MASSASPPWKEQRSRYADAFLNRCAELSIVRNPKAGEEFDISRYNEGTGTYLAVWLKKLVPERLRCSQCNQPVKDNRCWPCSFSAGAGRGHAPSEYTTVPPTEVTDDNIDEWARYWATSDNCSRLSPFSILGEGELTSHPGIGSELVQSSLRCSDSCENQPVTYARTIVQVNLLTQGTAKAFVTDHWYFNVDLVTCTIYMKDRVLMWQDWRSEDEEEDEQEANEWRNSFSNWIEAPRPFVKVPETGLNASILSLTPPKSNEGLGDLQQHGGSESDVWTTQFRDAVPHIKSLLDEVAAATNDCPIPKYQMIIDPNQFVRARKLDGETVWVPSEFDISADGTSVQLVGGDRAHWMDRTLIEQVTTPVLKEALPLLARLRKPHLLLEGQRLQVAVKAQRIKLPPTSQQGEESEYVGLWHVDGEHESVVAVVLYYYDVDDVLVGGNMEFIDRRPIDVLGSGDCSNNYVDFTRQNLRTALRPAHGQDPIIPNCSVPIKTGTLLVFSNYQMAHRVLRMVNQSPVRSASRNFVALFILDPAVEPLVPARCHLARPWMWEHLLTSLDVEGATLCRNVATLILEFMGIVPSAQRRKQTRNRLLLSQLQPKGRLGSSRAPVTSTGNGCYTMIGWFSSMLQEAGQDSDDERFNFAGRRTHAMNASPQQVGRGLSENLSLSTEYSSSSEEDEAAPDRFIDETAPINLAGPGGRL